MAQLTITIPDAQTARVFDAFAAAYGYQATIDGQPNPQTRAQFARQKVIEFIKNTVKAQEAQAAADSARSAAAANVESQVNLS